MLFFFCIKLKCWFSGLEFTKCLSEKQIGKTLIRLLLQKQSDLRLCCLSRRFCLAEATIVRNIRAFSVVDILIYFLNFPDLQLLARFHKLYRFQTQLSQIPRYPLLEVLSADKPEDCMSAIYRLVSQR